MTDEMSPDTPREKNHRVRDGSAGGELHADGAQVGPETKALRRCRQNELGRRCAVTPELLDAEGWCISHSPDKARKLRAVKLGGLANRPAALPADSTLVPAFRSRDDVILYAEENARRVAIGELHPALSREMREWAHLALDAHELAALERLARIERLVVKGRRIG